MPPRKKRKAPRKKAARPQRKKARKRGPKKKSFLKLKPKTRKKIEKSIPIAKLLFVLLIGSFVYFVGSADEKNISQTTAKKPVVKQQTSSTKSKATAPKKVVEKKTQTVKTSKPVKKTTTPPPPRKTAVTPPAKPKVIKQKSWSSKPKLVFVIDDMGNKISNEYLFRKLGSNVTYAILPLLNYSTHFSKLSVLTGAETILHLPLEAKTDTIPGPGLITNRMSPSYVLNRINKNLKSVPHHVGANNHMGSFGTSDPVLMEIVLKEFKRRGLFFLDSYTSASSTIMRIGREIGLPVLKRDVFLDNVDEPGAIRIQIRQLERVARAQGYAIGIGHDRKHTLTVILEELPSLRRKGFEIISLGELLDYKHRK